MFPEPLGPEHIQIVYRASRRAGIAVSDLPDFVSDCLLTAWLARTTYRGGDFTAFLCGIVRYRVLQHWRRQKIWARARAIVENNFLALRGERTLLVDTSIVLQASLDILDPRHEYPLVVLTQLLEYTLTEAAQILEIEYTSARRKLHASLAKLRDHLTREDLQSSPST